MSELFFCGQADGAALVAAEAMELSANDGRNSTSLLASISGYIQHLRHDLDEKQKVNFL